MSSHGITAGFYFGRPVTSPGDLLAAMVEALAQCPLVAPEFSRPWTEGAFGSYEVRSDPRGRGVAEAIRSVEHGQLFPIDVTLLDERGRALHAAHDADPASLWWEVGASYHGDGDPCGPDEHLLPLSLSTVGDRCTVYAAMPTELAVRGRHQVAGATVGHYRGEPYLGVSWEVEQRLDALLQVLTALTERLQPYSVKVAMEGCRAVPEAGLAYYSDLSGVVEDLRFLQREWEQGLDYGYNGLSPLRERWRGWLGAYAPTTARAQRQLWHDLDETLRYAEVATAGDVEAVMASGRQDWYHLSRGQMVMHYPFFMNETLADFYVAVLRQAQARFQGPEGIDTLVK
jgi:hypothetical protein